MSVRDRHGEPVANYDRTVQITDDTVVTLELFRAGVRPA